MTDTGNAAQVRMVAEQVAEAVILKFAAEHPELRKTEIPPPLKWAGAITAALFTTGVAGTAFWIVSSVSEMQVTLARMDERQVLLTTSQDKNYNEIERRVTVLEGYHKQGGNQ